eukprot:TRINITY_DN2355_c0_g1_i5.p1 TRINITY_DN2355_c0_g1~~TRINITY_DN2355_c0_g1_i5.p1  ORF type:complete len:207 (-),score=61.17 TRINITY_DN2355_c0_g1_i5:153-773(-)
MGSKNKGEDASAPAACKSYHIENNKCQDGPKLIDKDKVCTGGKTTCKYRLANNTEISEECKCGMNAEGKSYCSPGRGDFDLKPYFDYVNSLPKDICHHSTNALCLYKKIENLGKKYWAALRVFSEVTRWEKYQDNPEYVKQTINYNYWYTHRPSDDEQKPFGFKVLIIVSVVTVVISAIAIVILFKCRIGEKKKTLINESDDPLEP